MWLWICIALLVKEKQKWSQSQLQGHCSCYFHIRLMRQACFCPPFQRFGPLLLLQWATMLLISKSGARKLPRIMGLGWLSYCEAEGKGPAWRAKGLGKLSGVVEEYRAVNWRALFSNLNHQMTFSLLDFCSCLGPITLCPFRFLSKGMWMSTLCLSCHCILAAHNLPDFTDLQLESNFASVWLISQVSSILNWDGTLTLELI